ncbi:hypothetical protein CCYS_13220 [Corynebacterium cystitidis DSM 20524]|nr:hypothetical protein CCYS_13220 [Corynebacterium cystitidis DSM 20524]SNV92281.1 Uncharacterised protein [Corynebacterium cystitidis]
MGIKTFVNLLAGDTASKQADHGLNSWDTMAASLHRN